MSETPARQPFWVAFGPGILFAGAAVGTSHLVQSTRAGAVYGLGMLGAVLFAHLIKYPTFRFGPQYAAATGRSLLHAYSRLGRWVVAAYCVVEAAMAPIIIAATAVVTAAIGSAMLGWPVDARHLGVGLIFVAVALNALGGYGLLDRLTKYFVVLLTVLTLVATALTLDQVVWDFSPTELSFTDFATFGFLIALIGFMPSGMDASVIHSLWTVAKIRDTGQRPGVANAVLDFHAGYLGTAVLAICFLLMGAGVMHTAGVAPAKGASEFAGQVVDLYSSSLGFWAGKLVSVAAFFVMFTTLMTVVDGIPRGLAVGFQKIRNPEPSSAEESSPPPLSVRVAMIGSMSAAAAAVLLFLMGEFQSFIDFVTISAFIVGPITALFNHLAVCSSDVPLQHRPGPALKVWSALSVLVLTSLAVVFLIGRFG